MSPETIHIRPHEDVAERVLLPGDPGRALRLAQQLIDGTPKMLNHNRGLWGYSGIAHDGAAADRAGDRHGRPQRGDRGRGAGRSSARAGCVRVGTCGAL